MELYVEATLNVIHFSFRSAPHTKSTKRTPESLLEYVAFLVRELKWFKYWVCNHKHCKCFISIKTRSHGSGTMSKKKFTRMQFKNTKGHFTLRANLGADPHSLNFNQ
jgi:hypothetical protein